MDCLRDDSSVSTIGFRGVLVIEASGLDGHIQQFRPESDILNDSIHRDAGLLILPGGQVLAVCPVIGDGFIVITQRLGDIHNIHRGITEFGAAV